MIQVKNLIKDYGSNRALNNVSLETHTGEILGLLGPNGAGKTTLMRIITGFLNPTSGSVVVDHLDVSQFQENIQSQIGYLPENTPLSPELNVYEQLEFIAMTRGIHGEKKEKAIQKMIDICGLNDYVYFGINELSKGYRQRVGLAQALIHNPKILILDEPTTGLDPNQIVEIRNVITSLRKDKTVILSTHIMQEVEAMCDRVLVINKGEVVADGSPDTIKHSQGEEEGLVTIHLEAKGPYTKIQKMIQAIPEVVEVAHKSTKDGLSTFVISAHKDVRSQINKVLVQGDYEVLEISLATQTMESAFHKLTQN